jgi:DNA-directed RNA polymerase specialized sigma24 family protein
MDEHDWLAERFEADRTRLRAVAYRMLGSLSEADDAVQETWLRLSRADTSGVHNLGGWLTTLLARTCLDMLRARTSRREEPLDVHLPDPIISRQDRVDPDRSHRGALPGRGQAAGQPCPPPGAGGGHGARGRPRSPAGRGRRLPGGRARR